MTSEAGASVSLQSVGRSALILTGGAAAVQVIGIIRELFLAAQVGASAQLDAFLIAIVLPLTLPTVLTSGATTALVPAYLEARQASGITEARRLAGTILVWVGIGGAMIWVVLAAFARVAVAVTGPGLSDASRVEAIGFLELLAPIAFVTALSAILFAVCQAEELFLAMSAATFAGPFTTLLTMLLLWDAQGLRGLAVGSVIGPIIALTVLVAALLRASLMPLPVLRPTGRLLPFARHAAPLTAGAAVLQLNVIADRAVASLLGPGAVSVLRYADVLVRVPMGSIGPAWGSAIYPALVRSTLSGVRHSLAADADRALRYVTAVFVPVAMLTAAVAPLAVRLAYGRGAYSVDALSETAAAVAAFAPLLLLLMIQPILVGAHNARRRGKVLLAGATMNVVFNATFDVVLGIPLGVAGIALSSSITAAIVLVYFTRRMTISEAAFGVKPIARTLALALLAGTPVTVGAALFCWTGAAPSDVLPGIATLVGIAIVGTMSYLLFATLLGMEEPRNLVRFAVDRLLRGRQIRGTE